MITIIPSHIGEHLIPKLHQLVLFPEVFGVRSIPLASWQEAEAATEQGREERALIYQQALEAGQLPLFA